jgi:hypothetical protein
MVDEPGGESLRPYGAVLRIRGPLIETGQVAFD